MLMLISCCIVKDIESIVVHARVLLRGNSIVWHREIIAKGVNDDHDRFVECFRIPAAIHERGGNASITA